MTTETQHLANMGMLLAMELLNRQGELTPDDLVVVSFVASHVLMDNCPVTTGELTGRIQDSLVAAQMSQVDEDAFMFEMHNPGMEQ